MRHKNTPKQKQKFKMLFSKINLHVVISNQKSTDNKMNLPLINRLLTYKNAKKIQTDQSILHVFYIVWKETTNKPLGVAATKSLFSTLYVTGTTFFKIFYSMW